MNRKYNDAWDKRVYVFLKRFENEGYILKLPRTPEGLEEYPTPRTWSWLALDLYEGFNELEDICGLVGEEVGMRFHAFLKLNVDIDELIAEPKRFHVLDFLKRFENEGYMLKLPKTPEGLEEYPTPRKACKPWSVVVVGVRPLRRFQRAGGYLWSRRRRGRHEVSRFLKAQR